MLAEHAYCQAKDGYMQQVTFPGIILKELDHLGKTNTEFIERIRPLLPSTQALHALLNASFYASIEREEGRALRFVLGFASRDRPVPPSGTNPYWSPIFFDTPRPVTVPEIIKLAPAIDDRQSFIAVDELDDEPLIWGLVRHGTEFYRFNRGEGLHSMTGELNYFRIHALGSGILVLSADFYRFLRFRAGEIVRSGPAVLRAGAGAVFKALYRSELNMVQYWSLESLRRITLAMVERLHGGTIIVLPDPQLLKSKHFKRGRLALKPTNDLGDGIKRHNHASIDRQQLWQQVMKGATDQGLKLPGQEIRLEITSTALRDAEAFVASLSQVDGAVVLGPELELLAFGAVINWNAERNINVKVSNDLDGTDLRDYSLADRGTRHQSAAAIADEIPGAVVIVVSQDGEASCFLRESSDVQHVLLWRNMRLDLYPELHYQAEENILS